MFSAQIFQENTFLKTKPNFPLTRKCFPLTNFSNGKQTQESLESGFPETTFRKTNTAKRKNTFLETISNFSLTGKCFSLTNFSNSKQTHESLESSFPETTFQETNVASISSFFPEKKKNYPITGSVWSRLAVWQMNSFGVFVRIWLYSFQKCNSLNLVFMRGSMLMTW